MDKSYLLTYVMNGKSDFSWFDTQEEMEDFIKDNTLDGIFNAIKINDCEELEIRFDLTR